MLQAALFDMDGVIVDNRDAHLRAFAEFARRHGIPGFDASALLPYFGSTNAVIMGHLFGRDDIPDEEVERLSQEKEAIYRELYDLGLVCDNPSLTIFPFLGIECVCNTLIAMIICSFTSFFPNVMCGNQLYGL